VNKAILIVICDFLVSAMLTMMTGMVPAHTGGTGVGLDENTTRLLLRELDQQNAELEALRAKLRETVEKLGMSPEREAELRRLAERLAANKVQQEKLRASLEANDRNTGELTPEELQRRLDAERQERARLEIELQDRQHALAASQKNLDASREQAGDVSRKLQETTDKLVRTSEELQTELRTTRREAAAQREELASERRKHDATRAELDRAKSEHSDTKVALARTESELAAERRSAKAREEKTTAEVKRLNTALTQSRGESEKLQRTNANLRGRLSERQKEHAADRDRIANLEKQLEVEKMKRAEAEGNSRAQGDFLKSTTAKLSDTEKKLSDSRAKERAQMEAKTQAQARLEAARKMLEVQGRQQVDEALERYAGALVKIKCEISENATFRNRSAQTESLYPVVYFNGKPILIGLLNRFAGDEKIALDFKEITNLSFTASPSGGSPSKLTYMNLPRSEKRIAGFPYRGNVKPLTLLTAKKLRSRGVNGLYLFKGTNNLNTQLNGRVSLIRENGKDILFIRNAGRSNNELNAEPGDVIISSEGYFVGIVVANKRIGGMRGVEVALLPSEDVWNNPVMIPLDKKRFGEGMRKIRTEIPPAYDQR